MVGPWLLLGTALAAEPLPASATDPGAAVYGMRGVDYACAVCQALEGKDLARVTATSSLAGGRYQPAMALDGDLSTAWCEGAEGTGAGQALKIELARPLMLEAVGLRGGYFKTAELLAANGRIRAVRLRTDTGVDQVMRFADPAVPMAWDPSLGGPEAGAIDPTRWFQQAREGEIPRHAVDRAATAETPPLVRWLSLELVEVWPGSRYGDTCLSEVELLLIDPAEL